MNRKSILLTLIILLFTVTALVQTASAQTYVTYVTQEGDSLSKIAAQYCTTWTAIYQINQQTIGPDPNIIIPGMVLTIPAYCTSSPTPPPSNSTSGVYDRGPQPAATGYVIPPNAYVVNWGDTMSGISARFGVSSQAIADANGISDPDWIYYGQVLYIPGLNGGYPPQGYPPQPTPPPSQTDTDGDSTPDAYDLCPYEYGSTMFNGCPTAPPGMQTPVPGQADTDGDSTPDAYDLCPYEYGSTMFNGCPTAPPSMQTPAPGGVDTDGDSTPDAYDMCPTAVGVPEFHGCPSDV